MPAVAVEAYGKINLALDVEPRRGDGYHPIDSVMLAVALADRLTLEGTPGRPGVHFRLGRPGPPGKANLAVRAAAAVLEGQPEGEGLRLTLEKHLPAGSGLGGASADAAAVLRALVRSGRLGSERASFLAQQLGSDVPFLASGLACARAQGRGELLTPLPAPPEGLWVVVAAPPFSLSTPEVYRRWDEVPERTAFAPRVVAALRAGRLQDLYASLGNGLEGAALSLAPDLARLRRRLEALLGGRGGVAMTGSGSAWYALVDDPWQAWRIARGVEGEGRYVAVTRARRAEAPGEGGR